MTVWLADTSVAVPLVQSAHAAHQRVRALVGNRRVDLPTHAAAETYSVLTRLPGDARLDPADARDLLAARFPRLAALNEATQQRFIGELATAEVAGGAVYDAVIAITAREHGATLLTRDARAAGTYRAFGVEYELVV